MLDVIGYIVAVIFLVYIARECFRLFTKPVDLRKRAVFVTGCDTGFGRMLVEKLADMDVTVFAGCLGKSSLEGHRNIQIVQIDVSSQCSVENAVKVVQHGLHDKALWAVVNNAGIAETGQIEWMSMSIFERIMAVNFFGIVRVTKAFLPLIRLARGRIVNIASIAGSLSPQNMAAYCSSKAAVIAFSDSLRREMKRFGVTVSTIEPAFFRTHITKSSRLLEGMRNMWAGCNDEIKSAYGDATFKWCVDQGNLTDIVSSTNVHLVINAMVDAITSQSPRDCYVVPKLLTVMKFMWCSFPYGFGDFLMEKVTNMMVDRKN